MQKSDCKRQSNDHCTTVPIIAAYQQVCNLLHLGSLHIQAEANFNVGNIERAKKSRKHFNCHVFVNIEIAENVYPKQ